MPFATQTVQVTSEAMFVHADTIVKAVMIGLDSPSRFERQDGRYG
jgi:hypothetical protein